jgi:uncharacterized membrane protein YphA (DoxX/SURF4 family)
MRHALALHIAPLLLRVGLGVTFLWAGAAKLTQQMPVNESNRAQLAQWGVIEADASQTAAPSPEPEQPSAAEDDAAPPAADPPSEADEQANASLVALQTDPADSVRRVYGLALLIDASANPAPLEDGTAPMPLWPLGLASGKLPVYFAWAAAVTELVAGIAVLFGFFTRLGAFPLAGTMAVAMWLTQVGPAIQSGDATLGVLPAGMFDLGPGGYVYTQILWQFALLLMAGALFCTGPGFLSIDRLLFGPLTAPAPGYDDEGDVELVPMSGRRGHRPSDNDD